MAATEQKNVVIELKDGTWWCAFETRVTMPEPGLWRPVNVPLRASSLPSALNEAHSLTRAAEIEVGQQRFSLVIQDKRTQWIENTGETPVPLQKEPG